MAERKIDINQAKNLVVLIQEAMSLLQPILTSKDKEKLEELKNKFNTIYELLREYVYK
jgi:iron uptake system EfeUOB component EfeO/EfeM